MLSQIIKLILFLLCPSKSVVVASFAMTDAMSLQYNWVLGVIIAVTNYINDWQSLTLYTLLLLLVCQIEMSQHIRLDNL